MIDVESIDLSGITVPGPITFLRATVPARSNLPFALIEYKDGGRKQRDALRLDLDKRVFLDHFEDDAEKEHALQLAQSKIVDCVSRHFVQDADI